MRAAAALIIVGLGFNLAQAQSYPAVMTVTAKDVEVRSGPTKEYHATTRLKAGDRVLVRRQSKDQPAWLAIAPPQGSFSWINAKHVKQIDARTGYAIGNPNEEIQLLPGSSMVNAPPNTVSYKVKPGYQFAILGPPTASEGSSWLPISPHPEEDRYLPVEAVRSDGTGGAVWNSQPAGAHSLIAQADQAYFNGNLERAKQLYKDAAERTNDNQQKSYCYNRLASLERSSWSTTPPGHPGQASGSPTQLASLVKPAAETAPAWSKWGVLRGTAFDKDGQPMYILENERGTPLMYVTTAPGFSLRSYLGKMVAVYGSTSYHNLNRVYYMTASHVAENNR